MSKKFGKKNSRSRFILPNWALIIRLILIRYYVTPPAGGSLIPLNLCAKEGFIWIHSLASRWKVQIFWNWSFHFSSSIWLQFHWKPTIFSNNECAGSDDIIQYAESVVMHINFKSNWKWFIIVKCCKLSLRVNLAASLNSWNVEGPNLRGGCDKTRAPRPSQLYLGSGLPLAPRVAAYRWNHG